MSLRELVHRGPGRRVALVGGALAIVAWSAAWPAAPARAAAAWSTPMSLSHLADAIITPTLTRDAEGGMLLAWSEHRDGREWTMVRARGADLGWDPVRTLGWDRDVNRSGTPAAGTGGVTTVVPYGHDRLLAVADRPGETARRVVKAWTLRARGPLGPGRVIDHAPWIVGPGAASDGSAVAVWSVEYGPVAGGGNLRPRVLYLVRRPAKGRLGNVQRISPIPSPGPPYGNGRGPMASAGTPQVAMAGRTVVVAWQRRGRVEIRVSLDGGRRFGPVRLAGLIDAPNSPRFAVAATPGGDVLVAWCTRTGGPSDAPYRPILCRARTAAHGGPLGPPVVLERFQPAPAVPGGSEVGDGIVRAAYTAAGVPLVAWEGLAAGRHVVRVAPIGDTGLGDVVTYSAPGGDEAAVLDDLVAAQDAEAAAVGWHDDPLLSGGRGELHVAQLGAGGIWGPAERLAPGVLTYDLRLSFAPTATTLTAVWRQLGTGGQGESLFAADRMNR